MMVQSSAFRRLPLHNSVHCVQPHQDIRFQSPLPRLRGYAIGLLVHRPSWEHGHCTNISGMCKDGQAA